MRAVQDVMHVLRAEFAKMPGLHMTSAQVEFLCGIEPMMCRVVLDSLVKSNFLCVQLDGHYALAPERPSLRSDHVKADIRTHNRPVSAVVELNHDAQQTAPSDEPSYECDVLRIERRRTRSDIELLVMLSMDARCSWHITPFVRGND